MAGTAINFAFRLLEAQAANRDLSAAYLVDQDGRILASAEWRRMVVSVQFRI